MPAPIGFLRSSSRRQGPLSIQRATEATMPAIEDLLQHASRAYTGLGGAMRTAIRDDLALAAWQEQALAGFVMVHQQGPDSAWIHAFGLAADVSATEVSAGLLEELERRLLHRQVSWIGYMDEHDLSWLRRELEQHGFQRQTRVVAYEAPLSPPPAWGNQTVEVRPAEAADLAAVTQLDQAAFGPLWAYHRTIFQHVLGEAFCFLVAEQAGGIVGYILGTRHRNHYAHIVRVAVHPRWQGQQIGVRLLAEAFGRFRAVDLRWVGLNTQEENVHSQRLYRWFGFRPTGDTMGVWVKQVGPDRRCSTSSTDKV